jgi:hypothetical protein
VLASRLEHSTASREEKERSHEWLARKDFNIQPMLDCLKERRKEREAEW